MIDLAKSTTHRTRRVDQRVYALLVLATAGVLVGIDIVNGLDLGSTEEAGPGLFPLLACAILVLAALTTAGQFALAAPNGRQETASDEIALRDEVDREEVASSGSPLPRLIAVVALPLLYVGFATQLGHIVTVGLLGTMSVRVIGHRRWLWSALFGFALGVLTYVVFAILLEVPLPEGILR